MKKATTILMTFALAGVLSTLSFAQQDQSQPDQSQPSPSTQSAPDPSSGQQPSTPSQDSSTTQDPRGSSFNGMIVKAAGKYVLNSTDTTYQLDDQKKAKQFVGQNVKINGTLDASTNMIHVSDVSPTN